MIQGTQWGNGIVDKEASKEHFPGGNKVFKLRAEAKEIFKNH